MATLQDNIPLPDISLAGKLSLPQLLKQRRSVRDYVDTPISLADIAQLLWAAQGITHPEGLRTAPSAGALYPLEIYLVVSRAEQIVPGVYRYLAIQHQLQQTAGAVSMQDLARSAFEQTCLEQASIVVVFAAVYARTRQKYGERGERYVHIEVGHAAQNLFLQAEELDLGTVIVGAFDDRTVQELLHLAEDVEPVVLMPVGRKVQ